MKLMLIDGNSIVNRAFFGIRELNAPDGTPTNAIYGFLAILQHLYEDQKPEAVCVAFDRREPTFRHRSYDFYKAQRKPMPEELAVQMPVLKELLDAMGVSHLELAGYEADDILGTLSVPVFMDADLGHVPPMLPFANGLCAEITLAGNELTLTYH